MQTREVLPVDVTSFLAIDIVATHTAWVVTTWWPLWQTALRPGVEVKHQTLRLHFFESFGLRTEGSPDGDAHVCILLVYFINHILCTVELRIQELHSVPVVVAAPVLPVLNDTIERHLQVTILVHHLQELSL